jgi:plasmid stabilization system protein ParE
MTYELKVRKEAEQDISLIFEYYEEIRIGLGHDFLLCIEEVFAKIERNPLNYRKTYKELRRVIIRRFPYRVFFFIRASKVVVTAVFHAQKDPESWQNRT